MIINHIGKKDWTIPTPDVECDTENIAKDVVAYTKDGKTIGTAPIDTSHRNVTYTCGDEKGQLPTGCSDMCYGAGKFVAVFGTTTIAYSKDGIVWEKVTVANKVNKVCYGDEGFIAYYSTTGYRYYSSDGEIWNSLSSAAVSAMCFGNDVYLELQSNGSVYNTTDNGETRVAMTATLDSDYYWDKICYGGINGGVFVAVPRDLTSATHYAVSRFSYTKDKGNKWTNSTLASYVYKDICYGNGMFILPVYSTAGGAATKYVYKSLNGTSWSNTSLPVTALWEKVFYISGWFYLCSTTGDILRSRNGSTWEEYTNPLGSQITQMADGIDRRIMMAGNKYVLSTIMDDFNTPVQYKLQVPLDSYLTLSYDDKKVSVKNVIGEQQRTNSYPQDNPDTDTVWYDYDGVSYAGNKFFTSPGYKEIMHETTDDIYWTYTSSTIGAYSLDGIIWQKVTFPAILYGWIGYGNDIYVVIGASQIKLATIDHSNDDWSYYPTTKAAYSTTGLSWTSVSLPVAQEWTSLCYGNGMFIAVGYSNTTYYEDDNTGWDDEMCVAISYTGKSWTKVTKSNIVLSFSNLCYGNGKFFAYSSDNKKFYYSNDGTEWHSIPFTITGSYIRNIVFGNDLFVILTSNNYVYFSKNLYDWDSTYVEYYSSINYGNGMFHIGSKYSYDCKNWYNYPYSVNGVYGNGRWVNNNYSWTDKVEYINHTLDDNT